MVNLENTEGLEASGSQSWLHIRVPRGVLKKIQMPRLHLKTMKLESLGMGPSLFRVFKPPQMIPAFS